MTSFKNIALWGVGGDNIGGHILSALVNDGTYKLTVIARQSSKSTYPSTLDIIRVEDDLSHASLVKALKGQDVVISAVGPAGIVGQYDVAKAAADAGVKRFIPSEYGFDNADPKNAALSGVFRPKHDLEKKLVTIAQQYPDFGWTALATGIWLDWGLEVKFLDIDPEAHTATYWDEGKQAPSMTTLPYAAQGVIQLLRNPQLFKNQRVFMQAFAASQSDIVAELEKLQGIKYKVVTINGPEKVRQSHATLANGFDLTATLDTIRAELFIAEYKADFVAAGKSPILEEVIEMPKLTMQDIVREYVAKQKKG